MEEFSLEWGNIYKRWRSTCSNIFNPITNNLNIVDVPANFKIQNQLTCSWWPTEKTNEYLNLFEKGSVLPYCDLPKGVLITAQNLWNFRDNPEYMALFWIDASLWYLEVRTGRFSSVMQEMIENIYPIIHSKKEELKTFEYRDCHCKETLPVTLFHCWSFYKMCQPTTYQELIDLIAIENILVRTSWSIVHLTNFESGRPPSSL